MYGLKTMIHVHDHLPCCIQRHLIADNITKEARPTMRDNGYEITSLRGIIKIRPSHLLPLLAIHMFVFHMFRYHQL